MAVLFALAITVPLLAQAEIDVNTASAMELQRIKGIGPKTAQAIIEFRNQNGPFNSIQAVTRVKGVGPKTLQKMIDSGLVCNPLEAE
jgi:competence protein ComEA